ncbi:MAG: hypothetical protein AB7G23_12065 [Vicinamibacterales bacterium]
MADLGTPPLVPRVLPVRVLVALGPLFVLLVWALAGRWGTADAEARAWLWVVAALGVAALVPVPGTGISAASLVTRLRWWGWLAVAGLLATT